MAEQETPVIFLHQVERRYHQGEATLEILKGAELAVWPGQSVALALPVKLSLTIWRGTPPKAFSALTWAPRAARKSRLPFSPANASRRLPAAPAQSQSGNA